MIIGGLEKSTLIDYPGHIACTVFLVGCNFRCPFCYSSELVLPEKIKVHPKIEVVEFFNFLKERKGLLAGVVVCGGEPTIYPELKEFIKEIKALGFLVKLDTNGSNPKVLQDLFENNLLDYVAMDVKTNLVDTKYNIAAGGLVDLDQIKASIKLIKESGVDYEFRTTLVPTLHLREDIVKLAKYLSPAKKYVLQGFRAEKTMDPSLEAVKPYPKEYLLDIRSEIEKWFDICEVRY